MPSSQFKLWVLPSAVFLGQKQKGEWKLHRANQVLSFLYSYPMGTLDYVMVFLWYHLKRMVQQQRLIQQHPWYHLQIKLQQLYRLLSQRHQTLLSHHMTQQHKSSRKAVADPLLLPNRLVYEGQPRAGEFALSLEYLLPRPRSCSWPKPFMYRQAKERFPYNSIPRFPLYVIAHPDVSHGHGGRVLSFAFQPSVARLAFGLSLPAFIEKIFGHPSLP